MARTAAELYEEDFYAWTQAQAQALRRLAAERWNGPLDLEHLAEEVEDLGREQRNAVLSQLRRIIEHRLKLAYSPAREPRSGWLNSIDDALAEIALRLTRTIRREAEAELPKLYAQAVPRVARELRAYGEEEAAARLPARCPWTLDELLAPPPEEEPPSPKPEAT